jgi:hypothetical protein
LNGSALRRSLTVAKKTPVRDAQPMTMGLRPKRYPNTHGQESPDRGPFDFACVISDYMAKPKWMIPNMEKAHGQKSADRGYHCGAAKQIDPGFREAHRQN